MHLLSTRVHGMLDYLVGLLMVASPWLFGFNNWTMASMIVVVMGAGAIGYSLFTRYELAVARMIPFNAHLALDLLSGVFLCVCAFWVSYSHTIAWPLLIFGMIEIGAVVLTGFRGERPTIRHLGRPAHA